MTAEDKFLSGRAGGERASAGDGMRRVAAWAYGCYAWGLFILIVVTFGVPAMLSGGPKAARRVVHAGARLLFRLARVPLSAKGLHALPPRPHVLVVNHASFLDAIALSALLPPSPGYAFVARQEFAIQALLWPLLRCVGTLVLKPPGAKPGRSNVDRLAAALLRGENLVIFPEGGFDPEPGLKHFHSGAFAAAANAGVPVVVAGLRGARQALRPRTWLPRRVDIGLEIGPVLKPSGNDAAALARTSAAARRAMLVLSGEPGFAA